MSVVRSLVTGASRGLEVIEVDDLMRAYDVNAATVA
jgi:hypothetical protein